MLQYVSVGQGWYFGLCAVYAVEWSVQAHARALLPLPVCVFWHILMWLVSGAADCKSGTGVGIVSCVAIYTVECSSVAHALAILGCEDHTHRQ